MGKIAAWQGTSLREQAEKATLRKVHEKWDDIRKYLEKTK